LFLPLGEKENCILRLPEWWEKRENAVPGSQISGKKCQKDGGFYCWWVKVGGF
jgi:hypothetical protein